jgi:hypothetical protein
LRHSRAALGTALLAPPGLSERTLSLLRQAFTQAMRDPALPGAELQRVVDATFDRSRRDRARQEAQPAAIDVKTSRKREHETGGGQRLDFISPNRWRA